MSDDTISRQAAIDALDGELTITGRENAETIRDYINGVNKKLRELPSAERRGQWIEEYSENHFQAKCSACGESTLYGITYDLEGNAYYMKYCPNCGASMMDDNATQHTECVGNALDEVTEMRRYIDAEKVEEKLSKVPWYSRDDERQAVRIVREFSVADVQEIRRGRWEHYEHREPQYDIEGYKTWAEAYKCSNCGFIHTVIEDFGHYAFCPRCGARMEEGGE